MEVVSMEDFKKEQKRRERKEKVEKIFKQLNDNKEVAAAVFTGILAVCKVGNSIHKNHVSHKKVTEERWIEVDEKTYQKMLQDGKIRDELSVEDMVLMDWFLD